MSNQIKKHIYSGDCRGTSFLATTTVGKGGSGYAALHPGLLRRSLAMTAPGIIHAIKLPRNECTCFFFEFYIRVYAYQIN
jgi:hypothetical protein